MAEFEYQGEKIQGQWVPFEIIIEPWSEYLAGGIQIRFRSVVMKVFIADTRLLPNGERFVWVESTNMVVTSERK